MVVLLGPDGASRSSQAHHMSEVSSGANTPHLAQIGEQFPVRAIPQIQVDSDGLMNDFDDFELLR